MKFTMQNTIFMLFYKLGAEKDRTNNNKKKLYFELAHFWSVQNNFLPSLFLKILCKWLKM